MSTRLRWPVLTAVAVLGAAILGLAASWVDWSVTAAWWVGLPLLLAGVWSFAGFHLSPVSAKTASGSPYATGRLHALVIVPASSAPDRVVSTVASLPDNADVTLVGGPDAAYLAAEMGIACCTSEGLVPLMASWPPHDVVFPITAGVLVEAGALGRAIEGMGARGASWTSALPVFDDFDAYVPPAPRLASQWWLANAVRASSRVWVPSCTLAPAGVLAGAPRFRGWSDLLAAAPADSFGTQFEEAFSLVLPPYDAQEFFAQRMADTRTDLTTSTRAFVGGGAGLSSRVSAAALWLRTARGVPMLLAATIPALLALTGVVFTRVPLLAWLVVLVVAPIGRALLVAGPRPFAQLPGTVAAAVYEFPVSLSSTVSAVLRRPVSMHPAPPSGLLLFLMLASALAVAVGEVLSRLTDAGEAIVASRLAGMIGVLVFIAVSTWAVVRCSRLRRSGRASVRFTSDTPARLGGVSVRLIDVSVGGALAETSATVIPGHGGLVTLDVVGGPVGLPAFVVRTSAADGDQRVSVTLSGNRSAQVAWASWVLDHSGLLGESPVDPANGPERHARPHLRDRGTQPDEGAPQLES